MGYVDAGLDDFFSSSFQEGTGLYGALPNGVRITFDLRGRGGGTWTISRDDHGELALSRGEVRRVDCCLRCTVDDFVALVNGDLSVRRAFIEERIDVVGDVGLVLRLQKILVARKGA